MIAATGASERALDAAHPIEQRVAAAAAGGLALGAFGATFSWRLDRLPRLAVASAMTGVLAGALVGAVITGSSPIGDAHSRSQAAAGGAVLGAAAGGLLLAGLAGIILPSVSAVTRFAAVREFALYGALAGGAVGAVFGAVRTPAARGSGH
jgi:hypothetical protein